MALFGQYIQNINMQWGRVLGAAATVAHDFLSFTQFQPSSWNASARPDEAARGARFCVRLAEFS